ncbi:OmpA family protein [Aureisphaera galaxeae]|uniref:OmpA family protein n=1 Tax=Aureisphaera galaxeae TaxID=1538023 RepID=UPI00234FB83E|nr:OmpA family protein [Aureisphaera galaxeae]MDC8003992.1 OmpA family protein [Aureisphaera galaxeae]
MKHLVLIMIALFAFQTPAEAQLFEKIKRKVKNKKEQKENETIDEGIEKVENIFKKKDKKKKKRNGDGEGEDEGASTESGPVVTPDMSEKKEKEIWMKRYDFKPGRDIIFFDDFENEDIGEIPSKWYYNKGLMEVVKVNSEQNHVMSGDLGYGHPNWEEGFTLPEAYTIEFDIFVADPAAENKGYGSYGYTLYFYDGNKKQVATIGIGHATMALRGKVGGELPDVTAYDLGGTWNHISISVNGNSFKGYFNDYRMFNTRIDPGAKPVFFTMWNCCQTTEKPVFLIDNFKVAAGAHPKYKEEILEGKIVTQNILFETGSSEIIPRSYAEVQRIADVMKANADKTFSIEGHTDNVGADEYNLNLSNERAKSVKKALEDMGIDADRLTAIGFGEAIPLESNDTPEGRAMNRRVEFVVQ